MGEGTGELREEIEETRLRVGEEVGALSYKTDVGARLDDYVDEKKEALTSKVSGARDTVTSAVGSVIPSGRAMKQRGRRAKAMARRNPLGLAVGGAAVGFVAGLLVPTTSLEDEKLGDMATQVKDAVRETGQDALERGKDVAQSAVETVKEEGVQQGRELASDLTGRVQLEHGAGASGTRSP